MTPALRWRSFGKTLAALGHSNGAPQAARTFVPFGAGQPIAVHTSPRTPNAGEYRFPVRLGLRRWRRGRSSKRRHATAEVQNEGTPFRCLGPHTHWKAPAEAQARFSEDILRYSFTGCIRLLQHSHTAGQIELAELFKYNNSAANRQQPARASPTSFMMGKYELENVLSSVLGRVPRRVHRVR